MTKKSSPPRIAPLQRVSAEPITDPAEQAALDALRRDKGEPAVGVRTRGATGTDGRGPTQTALSRVLELCQQLPEKEQAALLAQLSAQLPPQVQRTVLEELGDQLPPEALRQAEEELQRRLQTLSGQV